MNDQKKLWDKLAKRNAKYYINSDFGKGITEEEFVKSGRSDFAKYVWADKLLKKGPFLEIGCGNGRILEHAFLWHTTTMGVDISGEMIRQARERIPGFYLAETDGYTLPFDDDSIGTIFSYLVFQHMKTIEMVESNFREAYRVLKPSGVFKVRVRTDKLESMDPWWAGVTCDETYPVSIGFKLLKSENVEDYGRWLWLQK